MAGEADEHEATYLTTQPSTLGHGKMRQYQIEGLNWSEFVCISSLVWYSERGISRRACFHVCDSDSLAGEWGERNTQMKWGERDDMDMT